MTFETSDIKKLQTNLCAIRKIAGWTAQELGTKIGVTKQTISNLENQKTEMTLTQYIAIRTVLDYEMANNPANEVLPQVVHVLLDMPDENIDSENRQKIDHAISTLAAAAVGGIGLAGLISISGGLLGGVAGLASLGSALGPASWLQKIMKKQQ